MMPDAAATVQEIFGGAQRLNRADSQATGAAPGSTHGRVLGGSCGLFGEH